MEKGKKYTDKLSKGWIYEVLGFLGNGDAAVIAIHSKRNRENLLQIPSKYFFKYEEYKEPRKGIFWINIYPHRLDPAIRSTYTSRLDADLGAGPHRIACVEVPWEEGQGLQG